MHLSRLCDVGYSIVFPCLNRDKFVPVELMTDHEPFRPIDFE